MNRIRLWLLLENEWRIFLRSRRAVSLLGVMAALGLIAAAIYNAGPGFFRLPGFKGLLHVYYSTYMVFLPLGLALFLPGVIVGERERHTWRFYLTKPFTPREIVLSKAIFYSVAIMVSLALTWVMLLVIAILQADGQMDLRLGEIAVILVIFGSSAFFVINFQLLLSAVTRRTVEAVLAAVMGWFALAIANISLPRWLGGGYWAPYADQGFQSNVVRRILIPGYANTPFLELTGYPTADQIVTAVFHPLLVGVFFILLALILVRR